MLSEREVIDQLTADEFGNLNVRTRHDILRDGEVVTSTYHRMVVERKDSLKGLPDRVARVARAARKGAAPTPKESKG